MAIVDINNSRGVYLAEIGMLDSATNVAGTLYFATAEFITEPGDTPGNQLFLPRLSNALEFGRNMYTSGTIGGDSHAGVGSISIDNSDGALDHYYSTYLMVGRPLSIKFAIAGTLYNNFTTVLVGIIESVEYEESEIILKLKDNQELLEEPISVNQYAETGTYATFNKSLYGAPLPLCYGKCLNVSPLYVGKVEDGGFVTDMIYQVHDGPISDILAVYSNGALVSGTYITKDLPNGKFTINIASVSDYTITCDVLGSSETDTRNVGYVDKVPDILYRILQHKAPTVPLVDQDFTDMLTDSSFLGSPIASTAVAGVYIGSGSTISQPVAELCASIGAYYGFDRLGNLSVGVFNAPVPGESVGSITDAEILDISRLPVALLSYQHDVGYAKNYTVMDEGSMAQVVVDTLPDRHTFLKEEFRIASATILEGGVLKSDNTTIESYASGATHWSIKDRYPTAKVAEVNNSLLIDSAPALLEARRRWRLYNNFDNGLIQRDRFSVRLKTQPFQLQLNDVIYLESSRYNISNGKYLKIVAFQESAITNEVVVELWG